MSACCGAASGLGRAFAKAKKRPSIIIGSRDKRPPADYVAAWSLLYRAFRRSGIDQEVAQKVLEAICAVVHKNFRYLRWSEKKQRYLQYPGTGKRYRVRKRKRRKPSELSTIRVYGVLVRQFVFDICPSCMGAAPRIEFRLHVHYDAANLPFVSKRASFAVRAVPDELRSETRDDLRRRSRGFALSADDEEIVRDGEEIQHRHRLT